MQWLGNKVCCFLLEILGLVVQIANMFLGNIAVYEVSTGLKFNFYGLLTNIVFWITIVLQITVFIVSYNIRASIKRDDDIVEEALRKGSTKLVSQAVAYSENGDFVSANKALEVFDLLQAKRK